MTDERDTTGANMQLKASMKDSIHYTSYATSDQMVIPCTGKCMHTLLFFFGVVCCMSAPMVFAFHIIIQRNNLGLLFAYQSGRSSWRQDISTW